MIKNKYRLEEYIITEYDRCFFTWEMNIVLGEHMTGNGFIVGNIFIIEPKGHEKDGCLKLEFHKHLMKLPVWEQTRYYCLSSSLRNVDTGKNLVGYFNRQQVKQSKITAAPVRILEPGIFCLDQYKIRIDANGDVSWQIYEGLNRINGGACIIESGFLYIGSKEYDFYESQSKREWLTKLRLLPKWDKTFGWGQWNTLRTCPRQKKEKSAPFFLHSEHMKISIPENMRPEKNKEKKQEVNLLTSIYELLYQPAKWKTLWVRLFLMFIDGFQFCVRIFSYFKRCLRR